MVVKKPSAGSSSPRQLASLLEADHAPDCGIIGEYDHTPIVTGRRACQWCAALNFQLAKAKVTIEELRGLVALLEQQRDVLASRLKEAEDELQIYRRNFGHIIRSS